MTPHGWTLVPIEPSERMLSEFAGHYWPYLKREKQEHERAAYAAMLYVVPTPPTGGTSELESLREQLMRVESNLKEERAKSRKLQRELSKVYSMMGQLRKDLRMKV